MKKITEVPGLEVNNQHRGLKIASALSIALPIFTTTFQRANATINKYSSTKVIEQTTGLTPSKGTRSTSWGRVWLNKYNQWYYSHTGWVDNKGNRYYCLNPDDYAGVEHGYTKSTQISSDTNAKIRAALYLGYGSKSAEDMGITGDGRSNKAEYATQLAVWHFAGFSVQPLDSQVKAAYEKILKNVDKYTGRGSTSLSIETISSNSAKGTKTVKITGKEFFESLGNDEKVTAKVSGLTAEQDGKKITSSGTLNLNKNVTLTLTGKPVAGKPVDSKDSEGNKVEKVTYTFPTGKLTVSRDSYSLAAPTYKVTGDGDGRYQQYQHSTMLVGIKGTPVSKDTTVKGSYTKTTTYEKDTPNIKSTSEETPPPTSTSENNKVRARIYKKDDEGKPVKGVEFTIYKSNDDFERGEKVETITTGSDGYATTSQLDPGYYIAIETKTNDNLDIDSTHVEMDLTTDTLDAADENSVKQEATKDSSGQDVTLYTATFNGPTNNHKPVEVASKATNVEDGTQAAQPVKGPVEINEKLLFKYLIEGQKYKINAWLVDKGTGMKIQVNGKDVSSESTFTAPASDSNYNSSQDVKIDVPDASALAGKNVVVYATVTRESNGKVSEHRAITDKDETISFTKPTLHTNASDQSDKDKTFVPTKDQKLVDKVSYTGLIKGKKYTVKGKLIDKSTGKAVQVDGKDVTFENSFTAENESGTVENPVTFDASALSGAHLVVYETLYYGDKELVDHSDIKDEDQSVTVSVPKAKVKISKKDDEGNFVQGVKFNIYKADKTWTKGDLVETVTTDKDGIATSSELPLGYYVAVESQTVKNLIIDNTPVKIDLNESVLRNSNADQKVEGNTLVFTAGANGPLNNHMVPELSSKATNFEDGTQVMQPIDGPVTINEHLFFNHLVANVNYTINAWLVDKATGQPLLVNGEKVETNKVIKSGSDDKYDDGIRGEADLQLTIKNASGLAGKDIVVYSTIARTSKPNHYTTLHEDINDTAETVHFTTPDLHTNASNAETKTQQLQPTNKETLVDKVSYTGLVKGKSYKIVGTVVDKETGKAIQVNGHDLTFTRTFTAESENSYVDAGTELDARKLQGKSLVVFENLYYNDTLLKEHKNINDVDQTVVVTTPELHTTLSEDAQKLVVPKKENVVQDLVSYKQLIKGQTYTITGRLVDQVTGKVITYNGKPVTATKTFKATGANGQTTVTFKFKGQDYQGHALVAFEDLTYKNRELAKHEEINDVAQTITVDHKKTCKPAAVIKTPTPHPSTTVTTTLPQTGNSNDMLTQLLGAATLVVTIGSAVYFVRRRQTTGLD